ncbi:MAG: carbohydrate ABC transporter permease, partial [Acidimicrobiia bacterium]|nr:carbohydrate ABC transporter permease [Acidimicrobiia bacterium]
MAATTEKIIVGSDGVAGEAVTGVGGRIYAALSRLPMWAFALLWLVPTFGLMVNSFRTRDAQRSTGFWRVSGSELTTENYETVFEAGTVNDLGASLLNSFAIAVPATIIPIAVAAFAAYGFAWIDFKGRKWLFIMTVSIMAIPLQVALIPLLR